MEIGDKVVALLGDGILVAIEVVEIIPKVDGVYVTVKEPGSSDDNILIMINSNNIVKETNRYTVQLLEDLLETMKVKIN